MVIPFRKITLVKDEFDRSYIQYYNQKFWCLDCVVFLLEALYLSNLSHTKLRTVFSRLDFWPKQEILPSSTISICQLLNSLLTRSIIFWLYFQVLLVIKFWQGDDLLEHSWVCCEWIPWLCRDKRKYDYSQVQRWTLAKKLKNTPQTSKSILECDRVIAPVHLGCHWTCAVVDLKNKEFGYYDSMLVSPNAVLPSCFSRHQITLSMLLRKFWVWILKIQGYHFQHIILTSLHQIFLNKEYFKGQKISFQPWV